ncbi:MAG: hypothetical protein ACREMQ_02695, partial [Longimicrobiales bacterium]
YFMGPAALQFPVPLGRIRLNAFGRQVYLGRIVHVMSDAIERLSDDIRAGAMRPVGSPATERRGADSAMEGFVEIVVANTPRDGTSST